MVAWKSIGRIVGYPLLHPQRTLRGMGATTGKVVAGGAAGYVGWEKLTTDKSLTRIVGDAVIGKETCDTVSNTVSNVAKLPEKAIDTMDNLTQTVDGASNQMSGIGNFVHNMAGGNFLDGIGNFFSNIGNGKVSGMSLLGLVASAFMLFGRFGWFGKIAGALLGMMILGNNMKASESNSEQQEQNKTPQRQQEKQSQKQEQQAQKQSEKDKEQEQRSFVTIHR